MTVAGGTSTVSSDAGGISCPSRCTHDYPVGAAVRLQAHVAAGERFIGWQGDCPSPVSWTRVIMQQDNSCTALFARSGPLDTWTTTVGGAADDEPTSAALGPSGLALFATSRSFTPFPATWLVRLDDRGAVRAQRRFGDGGKSLARGMAAAADGGLLLVAETLDPSAGMTRLDLVRVAADHSTLWQRHFRIGSADRVGAVAAGDGGGFAVAGSTITDDGSRAIWAMALRDLGEPSWTSLYLADLTETVAAIRQAPSGLFVVGSSHSESSSHGWLLRLSPSGQPLWKRELLTPAASSRLIDVDVLPDDSCVVLGQMDGGETGPILWLAALDAAGDALWARQLRAQTAVEAKSVRFAPDGSLLIAATIATDGGDLLLLEADGQGELRWRRRYGTPVRDAAAGMQPAPDGGLVAVGLTEGLGAVATDLWLLKLDAEGLLAADCPAVRKADPSMWLQPVLITSSAAAVSYRSYSPAAVGAELAAVATGVAENPLCSLKSLAITTAGDGMVSSTPASVVCPGACEAPFASGTEVQLEARPGGTSRFVGWTGDCRGAEPAMSLTLWDERQCGAVFADTPMSAWIRTYGTVPCTDCRMYSSARDFVQTASGDLWITGQLGTAAAPLELSFSAEWLVHLDATGALLGSVGFNRNGRGWGTAIAAAPAGGILAAGSVAEPDDPSRLQRFHDVHVAALSSSGDIEWQTVLDLGRDDQPMAIGPTGDGGVLLPCYSCGESLASCVISVVRLGPAGQIIKSQALLSGPEWPLRVDGRLTATESGGFLAVAKNGYDHVFAVVELSADGDVLAEQAFATSFSSTPHVAKVVPSGNVVIVGTARGPDLTMMIAAIELDRAFNLVWQKVYEPGEGRDELGRDFEPTADGGLLVLGGSQSASGGDLVLLKLDSQGEPQWKRIFTGYGSAGAHRVAIAADGHILLAGETPVVVHEAVEMKAFVMNLTPDGEVSPYCGDLLRDEPLPASAPWDLHPFAWSLVVEPMPVATSSSPASFAPETVVSAVCTD